MGCDIHMFLEYYIDDRWEMIKELRIGRNYELFGILGGVRDENQIPLVNPRGLPLNLSVVLSIRVSSDNYMDDCSLPWLGEHSFSYLCSEDLETYFNRKNKDRHTESTMDYLYSCLTECKFPSRLVFGFDC